MTINTHSIIYNWKPILEILILWSVIYHIMLFFEGTRAIRVLRGIIVLVVAFLLFQKLNFKVLDWLLTKLFGISIIAILIIFHQEIRQGLAQLGQRNPFGSPLPEEELDYLLLELKKAVENLSKEKLGALIAIEKYDSLTVYIESGDLVDSRFTANLIQAIFTPNNPLHDGGVVIRNGRIFAAGCLFPLSQNQDISRMFGTRHRAALGLSEETDAIIIIVSEERRDVSLVYRGRLYRDLGQEEIISKIREIIKLKKDNE
jgi:diadenylate cyclase